MNKTYWGEEFIPPRQLLLRTSLRPMFQTGVVRIFKRFGLDDRESETLAEQMLRMAAEYNDSRFEDEVQSLVLGRFDETLIRSLLDERASEVAAEIDPYLAGKTLLDVGAGDGMVSWSLRNRFERVQLVDVMSYVDPRVKLPIALYTDGETIPSEETFDTVLLINVLHHSNFPVELLCDSWGHASERLVLIESVYGDPSRHGETEPPFCFSARTQFLYTSFFDWFYNRVLHSSVPVPCNFAPPPLWEKIFAEHGLRLEARRDLGIDVDIVPIQHYLFVLGK
jgi:DREV methyltransferase